MSFYTEKFGVISLYPLTALVSTIATDYIGDQMIFTREGNHFSDDGYYYGELEMHFPQKAKYICEVIAHNNFCKFEDEAFVCDNPNHDEAVIALIQCGTAVGTYIIFRK
jgi:hypothetical protein